MSQALDVRCDYEKALILDDTEAAALACYDAGCLGHLAYGEGQSAAPALFQNASGLRKAWAAGWKAAQRAEALDD
jgi:hypothetical protein